MRGVGDELVAEHLHALLFGDVADDRDDPRAFIGLGELHRDLDIDVMPLFVNEPRLVMILHGSPTEALADTLRESVTILRGRRGPHVLEPEHLFTGVAADAQVRVVREQVALPVRDEETFAEVAQRLQQRLVALGPLAQLVLGLPAFREIVPDREDQLALDDRFGAPSHPARRPVDVHHPDLVVDRRLFAG
jgi:hypothetical protein